MDLSRLTDAELDALERGDLTALSDESLAAIEPQEQRGSALNSWANGVSMGFVDELSGLLGATAAKATGQIPEGQGFWDAYEDIRGSVDGDRKAYADREPGWAALGEVGGGVLTGGTALLRGVPKLAEKAFKESGKITGRAQSGAVVGGVEGGIAGAGNADPGSRATGAAWGAGFGVPLGGAVGAGVGRFEVGQDAKQDLLGRIGSGDRDVAPYRAQGGRVEELPGPQQPTVTISPDGTPRLPGGSAPDPLTRLVDSKLKKDKTAQRVLGHGIDGRFVSQIKSASKQDQRKMLDMVRRAKLGWQNNRSAVKNRPNEVIGDVITGRVNWIHQQRNKSGKQIDQIAKGLKDKYVDYRPAAQQFISSLEEQGVRMSPDGSFGVKANANAKGSDYRGLSGVDGELNHVLERLTEGPLSAYDLHQLKRFLDTRLNFAKDTPGGLRGRLETQVKTLRRDIDALLDQNFPEYDKANSLYSDAQTTLDLLQKGVGASVDLMSPSAVGIGARKLTTNYASQGRLAEGIEMSERMLRDAGLPVNNNAYDLVSMDTLLKIIVPQDGMNTLQGETSRSINQGARAMFGDFSAADAARMGVEKLINSLDKTDPGTILDALETMLKESL